MAHDSRLSYCIVAYRFPPAPSAGAARAYGLARGLAEAGNEVHVFTPSSDGAEGEPFIVHSVPGGEAADGLKTALGVSPGVSLGSRLPRALAPAVAKVLKTAKEWAYFPDTARGWADRCAQALGAWLDSHECDVIISTSPPVSAHFAVREALGGRSGPVWVADFRDLWTANPHYEFGGARMARDRRLERALLHEADAITVTTREMARVLEGAYPSAKVVPVYSGYDERAVGGEAPPRSGRPLMIAHAGYLYEGKRSVEPLLEAVANLLAEGAFERESIRLRFAGPADLALGATADRLGLRDVVEIMGEIPHAEVPDLLEASDVLLIVAWDPERESSLIPAKTFEYLAARRPILALNCRDEGEVGRLLGETDAGKCVNDVEDARAALKELYAAHSEGRPLSHPDSRVIAHYTQRRMAAEFDELAHSLVDPSQGRDRAAGVRSLGADAGPGE